MKKTKFLFTQSQRIVLDAALRVSVSSGYRADELRLQQDDEYLKHHAVLVMAAELFHTIDFNLYDQSSQFIKLSPGQVAVLFWVISDSWVYLRSNDYRNDARQVMAVLYPKMPK